MKTKSVATPPHGLLQVTVIAGAISLLALNDKKKESSGTNEGGLLSYDVCLLYPVATYPVPLSSNGALEEYA
jgi:hypothetical protein